MGFFLLVFVISLADYFVLLNKHYYITSKWSIFYQKIFQNGDMMIYFRKDENEKLDENHISHSYCLKMTV